MEIFLVGGAVRDEWLNLPVKDRDWVVIGATTQEMLDLGYRQVGKGFPVFLHPQTQEEYALGRMERKIAPGHQGFTFDCGPAVTLEEDLSRRDLTINAIAKNNKGFYIDPYHGIKDIENKILRHVSSAFIEDPLRVLRVFRFLARFKHLGFTVANETVELCQQIVDSGELASLTVERVWQECEKALQYKNPEAFFMGLTSINAISIITHQTDLSMQVIQEMNQRVAESVDGLLPEQIFALWVGDNRDLYENIRNHLPLPIKYRKWIEYVLYGSEILAQKKLQTVDNIWQLYKKTGSLRAEGDIAGLCKMLAVDEGLQNKIEKMHHNLLAIDMQAIKNQGKQGAALGKAIEDSQKSTISRII